MVHLHTKFNFTKFEKYDSERVVIRFMRDRIHRTRNFATLRLSG